MDDYYPFGLAFNSFKREDSKVNDFLYNGKEMQDELDLNWVDYGARMYDAAIGRFMTIDPHASRYLSLTPYNYVGNNPLNFTDPTGMDADSVKVGNLNPNAPGEEAIILDDVVVVTPDNNDEGSGNEQYEDKNPWLDIFNFDLIISGNGTFDAVFGRKSQSGVPIRHLEADEIFPFLNAYSSQLYNYFRNKWNSGSRGNPENNIPMKRIMKAVDKATDATDVLYDEFVKTPDKPVLQPGDTVLSEPTKFYENGNYYLYKGAMKNAWVNPTNKNVPQVDRYKK